MLGVAFSLKCDAKIGCETFCSKYLRIFFITFYINADNERFITLSKIVKTEKRRVLKYYRIKHSLKIENPELYLPDFLGKMVNLEPV